jgi:hypothetical protein
MLPFLVLALVIGVPVGWFISEFHSPRWVRLLLGCLSISLCFGVAFLAGCLTELNYNAWFGSATKDLIDVTIAELDAGREHEVTTALKRLQEKYVPTYENRARYDVLVKETVREMQKGEGGNINGAGVQVAD